MYKLTASQQQKIKTYLSRRLANASVYPDAFDLAGFELGYLSVDDLIEKDSDLYRLYTQDEFVDDETISQFAGSGLVPVRVDILHKTILAVSATEGNVDVKVNGYTINTMIVPSFIYFKKYIRIYGKHKDLLEIPPKDLFNNIMDEAISLKAADITISTDRNIGIVYYNVAKKFVQSQIIVSKYDVESFIRIMCFRSPWDLTSRKSKKIGFDVNKLYRGRGQINKKQDGYVITIRLLPNSYFDFTLESLNLDRKTITFLREYVMNSEFGIRLIVGATMSGKNTTALSCLREVLLKKKQKVVSVEMPVEQFLPGIEQINCEDQETYEDAVNSLIRQNPDYIYITEMSEDTAKSAIRIANTGKVMLSTLHANSCADAVTRLQDVTGYSLDKVIQSLTAIVYQELVRDEKNNRALPRNSVLYLSDERKLQLYGKSYGEVISQLKKWEEHNEQSLLTSDEDE